MTADLRLSCHGATYEGIEDQPLGADEGHDGNMTVCSENGGRKLFCDIFGVLYGDDGGHDKSRPPTETDIYDYEPSSHVQHHQPDNQEHHDLIYRRIL